MSRKTLLTLFAAFLLPVLPARAEPAGESGAADPGMPYVYEDWEVFNSKNTNGGLPNDHVFYVKVDGDRVWFGTEGGLALYEDGKWKNWTEEDGLPWNVISGIDVNPRTGEVWLALFGAGLARFSGGRFDQWHQLNSGLVNNVAYNVAVQGDNIWVATTAGTSRYNTKTEEWTIYTEKNAPMEEIWCYNIMYDEPRNRIWLAVWGGGILEFDLETEVWEDHRDPDGEMEVDLFRDDGPVHIITTGVAPGNGLLWVSTYFGVSRYDGRHWRGYMEHDSGLVSEFNNFIAEHNREGWACTDKGLSAMVDFDTNTWVTYRKNEEDGSGLVTIDRGAETIETRRLPKCLPNNFVLCADFQGDDVWVATSKGVARGKARDYFTGLRPARTKTATTKPEDSEEKTEG
jgi:frataxin-like iron-binding protein CyaY